MAYKGLEITFVDDRGWFELFNNENMSPGRTLYGSIPLTSPFDRALILGSSFNGSFSLWATVITSKLGKHEGSVISISPEIIPSVPVKALIERFGSGAVEVIDAGVSKIVFIDKLGRHEFVVGTARGGMDLVCGFGSGEEKHLTIVPERGTASFEVIVWVLKLFSDVLETVINGAYGDAGLPAVEASHEVAVPKFRGLGGHPISKAGELSAVGTIPPSSTPSSYQGKGGVPKEIIERGDASLVDHALEWMRATGVWDIEAYWRAAEFEGLHMLRGVANELVMFQAEKEFGGRRPRVESRERGKIL